MPIRQLTPMSEIDRYTEQQLERLKQVLIRNLMYIGETVLNRARSTNSYKDRTGNLRSSIGYVITIDGRIIHSSNFQTVKQGKKGSSKGSAYVKSLARKFPQGICLIVVAGMNYASYVSAKGLDVLDSSELLAERLVPQMLKQLGFH
ncbi:MULTISPECIES: hypothetical protein [Bacteroides]|uniref:hypothetical protein n=1 Tax=Bacteroides TaxID=816 RepID=UPI003566B322